MPLMTRFLVLAVASTMLFAACRKRAGRTPSATEAGASASEQPGSTEVAAGEKSYAASPPPSAQPPASEVARFNAPQPMNMYAPRYTGDYQAQLDAYNRVLRKWMVDSSNAPRNLQEIMGTFNSPKPPQPPAGRQLIYDPSTKTVRQQ